MLNNDTSTGSHECVLCVGCNMAPKLRRLDNAISAVSKIATIIEASDSLESPDDSHRGPEYLNVVLRCTTDLSLDEFKAKVSEIETSLGRTEQSKNSGNMPADIDIVIWDGNIISEYDYSRPYFRICLGQLQATLNF